MTYIIYGPPCSGKTTYIREHMGANDIVCDVDEIYAAISNHDPHDCDLTAHEVALKLKEHLLDIIRDRAGNWENAYVTSVACDPAKDAERIHADECVFIDTPYEICMERALKRPPHFMLLIDEWFQEYEEQVMLTINKETNAISLTRGDSMYLRVGMKKKSDGTDYVPQEGDVVRFAMNIDFTCSSPPLILKEIPLDTQILHLEPADTKSLAYGTYRYDVELTTASGDRDTFIEKGKFKITEEVY